MIKMYLRKSRADGEHETVEEVLQRHERILQEHALKSFGHAIPEQDIFREVVSGETIKDRPMMRQLLESLQSGEVEEVLVVDPHRLIRGDLRDCGTIIRAFQYSETRFGTPQKSYDLSDKYDRKFLEMELMRGNDYLEYVKEIMLRGRLASVAEGNFIGSVPPYGYDKVKVEKAYTLVENAESDV
ncbi:MAG: recombinase family protein, partial [Oscillospiraceae bacterium]|nr:recombinase family protein [Oscillospiraceae bacterium]